MSLAAFGVRKPVVANLVMFAIIGAGIVFGLSLRREFFPESEARQISITAPYPGAAPDEVEQTLAVKIEDAVADLDDIKDPDDPDDAEDGYILGCQAKPTSPELEVEY